MNDDHFLTTEEVLDYLQVNIRTIYRLIRRGEIPAVRVGRQWRFRKPDIDAWLAGHRSHGLTRGSGLERLSKGFFEAVTIVALQAVSWRS